MNTLKKGINDKKWCILFAELQQSETQQILEANMVTLE